MDYVLAADPIHAQRHLGTTDLSASGAAVHRLRTQSFVVYNRKDDMPHQLMAQLFGLRGVNLQQVFVPSCQAMVHAVRDGWGVAVLPRQLVHQELAQGDLVNLLPRQQLSCPLYWHCWNLQSGIIDSLTQALVSAAAGALSLWPGGSGRD
jgi:LysR family transcriptional regulator (chromosome initiation inhibitor)